MVTKEPSVSVIVRTYMRSVKMLNRCLDSLLNQNTQPKEIVLVHAGIDKALSQIRKSSRLVFVKQRGRGVSNACNEGIAESSGEIVAFIDDDAIASPTWIEFLLRTYSLDPKISGVGGPVVDGRTENLSFCNGVVDIYGRSYLTPTSRFITYRHKTFPYLTGCNASFRKKMLVELGGFDEFYVYSHEDPDVSVRIQQAGGRIVFQPKALVWHYFAPGPTRSRWIYNQERSRIYFALSNFIRELSLLMILKHMFLLQAGNTLNAIRQTAFRRKSFTRVILELVERELGALVGFVSGIQYRKQHSKQILKKGAWLDRHECATNGETNRRAHLSPSLNTPVDR